MKYLRHLFCVICFSSHFSAFALDSKAIENQADLFIKKLYHTLNTMPNISMAERIDWISGRFLGVSYFRGALGEGPNAKYDQFPRYRVDAFDCETYVTTVLSFALASNLESFQQCLKRMRYKNGTVSYLKRNHFTALDWNESNQNRKILKDITLDIKDQKNQTVALFATALINKPGWYTYKTVDTVRLQNEDPVKQKQLLAELKIKGQQLEVAPEKTPYLPFTALFPKNNQVNFYLFSQIPNGAIIEIVRPNWDLHKLIGTNLNISHLGFAIKTKDTLFFREASMNDKIIDIPLIDYLKDAQKNPTIKGINVHIVLPQKPLNAACEVEVTTP